MKLQIQLFPLFVLGDNFFHFIQNFFHIFQLFAGCLASGFLCTPTFNQFTDFKKIKYSETLAKELKAANALLRNIYETYYDFSYKKLSDFAVEQLEFRQRCEKLFKKLDSEQTQALMLMQQMKAVGEAEGIVVMSCGVGVQTVAAAVEKPVHPATNSVYVGEAILRFGNRS